MHKKMLEGKNILFFGPDFFGYENKMKEKMEALGATVYFYNVRSVDKAYEKALLKISPKFFWHKTNVYYEKIFRETKNVLFDYVFMIKCDMPSEKILKRMRQEYSQAVFCLYLYDSVRNIPDITKKTKYFDRVFSFDPKDCKEYGYLFRPLFYCDEYKRDYNICQNYKYAVSFVGTIHADRLKVINSVKKYCKSKQINSYWFCYLQSRFIYYFYYITKREFRSASYDFFSFNKMSSKEIAKIIEETKVVLDIQHPKQTGLTMRTIEMIGMNKKIITTNPEIKNYDFYNPHNILIIDRKDVRISDDFFNGDYDKLPDDIYKGYSLEAWIREILDI